MNDEYWEECGWALGIETGTICKKESPFWTLFCAEIRTGTHFPVKK